MSCTRRAAFWSVPSALTNFSALMCDRFAARGLHRVRLPASLRVLSVEARQCRREGRVLEVLRPVHCPRFRQQVPYFIQKQKPQLLTLQQCYRRAVVRHAHAQVGCFLPVRIVICSSLLEVV